MVQSLSGTGSLRLAAAFINKVCSGALAALQALAWYAGS